jgi:hypothetical protein
MHLAHITKNKQLADAVLRATESVQQFPSDLLKGIYNYYVAIAAELYDPSSSSFCGFFLF